MTHECDDEGIEIAMQHSERVNAAADWANRRIAHLGLGDAACILYGGWPRAADLVNAAGRRLDTVEHDDPWVACGVVLMRLESFLRVLRQAP